MSPKAKLTVEQYFGKVDMYSSPWVSGTRAAAYFGVVTSGALGTHETFEADMDAVLQELAEKTSRLGANAVVGLETTIDPFCDDEKPNVLKIHTVGTAAKLEPLF